MHTVPPEIIRSILTHLSPEVDVANFRLVQRSFADLGAEFLFHTIPFDLSRSSLSRLASLSSNPNLARCVKRIFVRIMGITTVIWPEYVRELHSKGIDHRDRSTREAAIEIFQLIFDSFKEFLYSENIVKGFKDALRGFPRLRDVTVGCNSPVSSVLVQKRPNDLQNYYRIRGRLGQPSDFIQMFIKLIDVLYLADVKLDSFEILNQPGSKGLTPHLVFDAPETIRRAGVLFQNCRSIRLSIEQTYDAPPHDQQADALSLALAPAERLETLQIRTNPRNRLDANHGNPEAILFSKIFGTENIWPKLRSVSFPSIMIHQDEIIEFLSRHKKTLREVSIGGSKLRTGSWIDVMKFIKQEMKLVELNISESLEDPGKLVYKSEETDMMAKYVLSDGPLPKQTNHLLFSAGVE